MQIYRSDGPAEAEWCVRQLLTADNLYWSTGAEAVRLNSLRVRAKAPASQRASRSRGE